MLFIMAEKVKVTLSWILRVRPIRLKRGQSWHDILELERFNDAI
jgi:hypothetical protein